jgi:hypothetical protein
MESLTVIILAVAAIVIAAMVWAFLSSSVGMQQTSADFIITSVEVRQMSTGDCRLFINIRNNGGQSFNRIYIEVSRGAVRVPLTSLQPGDPINLPPGQSFSPQQPYSISCSAYGWAAGTPILVSVTLSTPALVPVSKNVNIIIQYGA